MQIGGSNQSGYEGVLARLFDTGAAAGPGAQDADDSGDDMADVAAAPLSSQDDAVRISPQGYAATSADIDDGSDPDIDIDGDTDTDADVVADTNAGAAAEPAATANAQPVKSLVYGTLGLDRPDQPDDPNQAYSAGRWIAAGITLGGIVSLFV